MQPKLISLALFGAFTLPCAAFAETAMLDEVVVTATRTSQSLNKTLSDTTVLNEQAIRQSGAPDVVTLLRSLAGVEVVQSGGLGAQSSTFMRGTNSSHVLVLLDGVRISSATAGTTALEHLMLDNIARIEVVRGNVSSLYGSEAIGGVIQLFTKQGSGAPAFNASAGLGSHGTQKIAAGFSGGVNDTTFSVNVGNVKTNGISAINPRLAPAANPNNNGYDNSTVNAQVKHALNADHLLSATVFSTRGKGSFDNAFGIATDLNDTRANIDKFSLASDNQLSERWHSQLRWAQGTDENRSYKNGIQSSRFQTQNNQLVWQNDFKIADAHTVNFAVERLGQAVTSSTLFTQTSRNVNSVLGGYMGGFGTQQVQLNVRQDRYSDFGTANTGLFGYGIAFADHWRATASLSNGFKAPTFNDMYYPLSFGYQGNPNLKPERSHNKEVGLHYAGNEQRVDMIYFDNRISDLIASNAAFTTTVNINQAHITGQELSYAGKFGNTQLKASATFQNPRDAATGQALVRRAKEYANVAVSHDFAAWQVGGELRHSGARADVGARTLPAYQLLNLTARYQIDPQLHLSARIDNLFNRNYAEIYSYNTLGRTVFVGLTYQQ